jgi:hypothetical protein
MFVFLLFIFCRILVEAECRVDDGGINNTPSIGFSNAYTQLMMRTWSSAARRMGELCIPPPHAYRPKNGNLCFQSTNEFHSILIVYALLCKKGAHPFCCTRVK